MSVEFGCDFLMDSVPSMEERTRVPLEPLVKCCVMIPLLEREKLSFSSGPLGGK